MKIKKIDVWFLSLFTFSLLVFLIVIFLFRNILISYYFDQRAGKFNRKYNAELRVVNIHTLWPGELIITGLTLRPEMGDTLLKADTVRLSLNLLKFLTGHIIIRKLEMVNIRLSFIHHDTVNNWMVFFREKFTWFAPAVVSPSAIHFKKALGPMNDNGAMGDWVGAAKSSVK